MKKNYKMKMIVTIIGLLMTLLYSVGNVGAITLDFGTPIIAIDGDADLNVSVNLLSVGGTSLYTYGYFLNDGAIFNALPPVGVQLFQGGDVMDFALMNNISGKIYSLSGDLLDNSYSVEMGFLNEVTIGQSQQPLNWSPRPYYYNANITWTINTILGPNTVNTDELALNLSNSGNDGVAPVPEPTSLLLLGSGLLGLVFWIRKRTLEV